jgi:hypothetical protein
MSFNLILVRSVDNGQDRKRKKNLVTRRKGKKHTLCSLERLLLLHMRVVPHHFFVGPIEPFLESLQKQDMHK